MSLATRSRWRRSLVAGGAGGALVAGTALTGVAAPAVAAPEPRADAVQLEHLDRGLVAATTDEGVFLSWRLLGHEATGHAENGLTGADFRVYRDGTLLATVTDSTNYLDAYGTPDAEYRVVPVVDGVEGENDGTATPWGEAWYDLPLQKPADGVTPSGESYTYSANDMSVGDVTGDGQYEFVVKWDPSNSRDVSQVGYTGNVYVDTYTLEGDLLHRIDLGVNIRAGAHYTQFLVYDFDGDGRSEMMMKTAPGTKIIRYEDNQPVSEEYVTMPEEDLAAGYSHDDDYRMSNEDFREHVAGIFLDWAEHPEVVAGSWPATPQEALQEWEGAPAIERELSDPLTPEDAAWLTEYLIDEYGPARSGNNRLWNFEGFIVTGPEYLTVFDGLTGSELQTIPYNPPRHDDGLMWGDYAMGRIEPGNRVDRFLSGVAYLDGVTPSAIFARGYYTRSTIAAYDWDGEQLEEIWFVDSGWTPMSNPFYDGPHGVDGTDPEFGTITTQGQHSLSAADLDGDGKHEILYGAAAIDHDGSLLWSAFDVMPEGSAAPGETLRLGHGDAMHVTQIDPTREGKEIFMVFEGGAWAPYGMAMLDAATGDVLWGTYSGRDTGRGMIGDVFPDRPGLEAWASMPGGSGALGIHSAQGELLTEEIPGTNQSIRWAADMTTQIINGAATETIVTPTVDDWQRGTLLTAEGTATNNWTKGNPSLVADVFGDWREELLLRTVDSSAIRIYLSTEVTDRKLYTLMHDAQYRAEVARQQTVYNQPSYTSFYLASDIDWAQVPLPTIVGLEPGQPGEPGEPGPDPVPGPEFRDVRPGHPFYTEIRWMADTGLSTGTVTADGTYYYPARRLSRQAMAAFIHRYVEPEWVPTDGRQTFRDVPVGHPFHASIEWMAENGLAEGYDDGTYRPSIRISRQAMAAFMFRLGAEDGWAPSGPPSFTDVAPGHPFYVEIEWMHATGLSGGYDDGTFLSSRGLSRQATAAFLYRFDQMG